VLHRLLRSQNFDESAPEWIELVGVGDVAVQAHRVELGEDEDAVQTGMDAVGNRNIDKAVFACDRHGRL
jgi:hypothetical protein